MQVYVNGKLVSSTKLDEDSGDDWGKAGTYRVITIDDIVLGKGDLITIKGIGACGEFARIDKLEICKDAAPLLGALGDLVFLDADRDGLQDDGETGVEGITVELKDASGNVVATTTTAADGSYLFTDLVAGDYSVAFVLPEQYAFTTQDAGADDAIDSDADATTGTTGIVSLAAGETILTLDAGVILRSFADLHDDTARGCADEVISVDVLANDTSSNGGALAIHAINGIAIEEGQTIAIDGVEVTLSNGILDFDGETAFADLDIGARQSVDYVYTVRELSGATSDATVSVTFCGDANTLASLCESLPEVVEYRIVDEYANGTTDAFSIRIDNSGDARLDGLTFEAAYCVSVFDAATGGADFASAPVYSANLYCADADLLPDDVLAGQMGLNGQSAEDNLDLINWILNQDFASQGYTDAEVQAAIWNLTDSIDFIPSQYGDLDDVREIVALAEANGEGFVAGDGDLMGLIIDPDPVSADNEQPFIVAIAYDQIDCLC